MLEAGPDHRAPVPADVRDGWRPTTGHDWGYVAEPDAAGVARPLPRGKLLGAQVYLFGDTLAVNGQVICGPSACPHGYPHDSIAIQRPGTAAFQMQSCAAAGCPHGWQQVPDWPDGSYFWMAAPAVQGTSLYVIGERISQPAVAGQARARLRMDLLGPDPPGQPGSARPDARVLGQQPR